MTGRIRPVGTDIQTTTRIEYPTVTEPPYLPAEVPEEPSIPHEPEIVVPQEETRWLTSEGSISDSYEKPGQATTGSSPSQSKSGAPAGKPPSPQKPSGGFNVKLSKKAVLGIVLGIIIIAIVVAAFFLYPAISENESAPSENVSSLAATPTITKPVTTITKPVTTMIKNAGTAVFKENTLKPTTLPTTRPVPGNSGSKVGL
jgi:hypothetical protein